MKDIVERFLDYVSFETTSYEPIEGQASSVGQYVLAKHLKEELEKLDVKNLYINSCWICSRNKRRTNYCFNSSYGYF